MTWSKAAMSYLEDLQHKEYTSRRLPLPNESANLDRNIAIQKRMLKEVLDADPFLSPSQKEKRWEDNVKEIEAIKELRIPTKYENPHYYRVMTGLYEEIETIAKELNVDVRKGTSGLENFRTHQPLLGTLPTGMLNAKAIGLEETQDYLVVFESDMFAFCNLISKVVAMSIPFKGSVDGSEANRVAFSTTEEDIRKNIANNADALRRFQQLLLSYLLDGSPSAASQYLLKGPATYLAGVLRDSMELFIMGHECSHVRLGHVSDTDNRRVATALASGKVQEISYSWKAELEADLFGSIYSRTAMLKRGFDLASGHWGTDLFFTCDLMIKRTLAVLRTGKEPENEEPKLTDSHPPSIMRRDGLRSIARNNYGEKSIELGKLGELIIEILWTETRPLLVELYQQGKKVHPHFLD
jgi:hypothetical protein